MIGQFVFAISLRTVPSLFFSCSLNLKKKWLSYATSQSAIKSREAYKIGKYSRLASENGASFVPLVFEIFGSFSEAVSDFLKELAQLALSNAPDGSGFLSPIAFKNNWITEARKLLSISLAH